MTEANLNRVGKTKPESLFISNDVVGIGGIKARIARLKVAIDGRFFMRLSKFLHCEIH